MLRGEVWLINLDPTLGAEIRTMMLDPGESLDLAEVLPPLPRTA